MTYIDRKNWIILKTMKTVNRTKTRTIKANIAISRDLVRSVSGTSVTSVKIVVIIVLNNGIKNELNENFTFFVSFNAFKTFVRLCWLTNQVTTDS